MGKGKVGRKGYQKKLPRKGSKVVSYYSCLIMLNEVTMNTEFENIKPLYFPFWVPSSDNPSFQLSLYPKLTPYPLLTKSCLNIEGG